MIYVLHNTGTNPRVVFDSKGRPHTIEPRQTSRPIDLAEGDAAILVQDSRAGSPLKVTEQGVQVKDKPKPHAQKQAPQQDRDEDVQSGDDTRAEASELAASHIVNYGTFIADARRILGDKWPGGTPKKAEIVELLEAHARGE